MQQRVHGGRTEHLLNLYVVWIEERRLLAPHIELI